MEISYYREEQGKLLINDLGRKEFEMISSIENRNDVWSHKIKDHSVLTGMFGDNESAERAYQKLNEKGYNQDDIFWSSVYDTGIIVIGVRPHNMADAEFLENDWRTHRGEIIYR